MARRVVAPPRHFVRPENSHAGNPLRNRRVKQARIVAKPQITLSDNCQRFPQLQPPCQRNRRTFSSCCRHLRPPPACSSAAANDNRRCRPYLRTQRVGNAGVSRRAPFANQRVVGSGLNADQRTPAIGFFRPASSRCSVRISNARAFVPLLSSRVRAGRRGRATPIARSISRWLSTSFLSHAYGNRKRQERTAPFVDIADSRSRFPPALAMMAHSSERFSRKTRRR